MNSRMQLVAGTALIVLAAMSRLIPHPMNFAPITAIALFGGYYFDKRFAPVLPLAALIVSDIFLGFYDGIAWVYGSFLMIVVIGMYAQRRKSYKRIFISTLAGSGLFFIITNFGVWQSGVLYPLSVSGMIECYTAAIPFFRNALAGDLFYSAVLFGAFELMLKIVPDTQATKA